MTIDTNKEALLIIEKAYENGNYQQVIKFGLARIKNFPSDPTGPYWLGLGLLASKKEHEAIVAFKKAISIDSNHCPSLIAMAFTKLCLSDWEEVDDLKASIEAMVDTVDIADLGFVIPAMTLPLRLSSAMQMKIAQARSSHIFATRPTNDKWSRFKTQEDKIKVGYLIPDLSKQPYNLLIRDLFSFHNKDEFEVTGIVLNHDGSPATDSAVDSFDNFLNMTGVSDFEVARKIHENGISILVDMAGFNWFSRSRIMAMQPAPVQIHYLGYSGTMGAEYVPNVIVPYFDGLDKISFTEKTHVLSAPGFATSPFETQTKKYCKEDLGIGESKFVFCFWGDSYQIDEQTFKSWMEILHSNDSAILVLREDINQDNLKQHTLENDIDAERVVFLECEDNSAFCQIADVWLEPFNSNSFDLSLLAIWFGKPVICLSSSPHSGWTSCYNSSLGTPELNAETIDDYIAIANELYNSDNKLHDIKDRISSNKSDTKLFQPELLIEQMEKFYQNLIDKVS